MGTVLFGGLLWFKLYPLFMDFLVDSVPECYSQLHLPLTLILSQLIVFFPVVKETKPMKIHTQKKRNTLNDQQMALLYNSTSIPQILKLYLIQKPIHQRFWELKMFITHCDFHKRIYCFSLNKLKVSHLIFVSDF